MVETYFANVAAVAAKKPTILGHFDLIKKVNGSGKFFDESDPRYTAAAHKALEAAAQRWLPTRSCAPPRMPAPTPG